MTGQASHRIRSRIVEIARQLGKDASQLGFDENIPASGVLDSAAIMELILWIENEYGLEIPQEDLTVANLGTINAVVAYLNRSTG